MPFRAANGRPFAAQELGRIVFGRWGNNPAEDVVLCRIDALTLEIHCHGGNAAAARILRDLEAAGCTVVAWRDLVGRIGSTLESELAEALSQATTLRTAGILLEQANGLLRSTLESLQSVEIDCDTLVVGLNRLLHWADFGLHLTCPWKVVLVGRPNVGKSSLANAILGYTRSIVFDRPGTTRDVVTSQTAIDGWPIEIFDTAGIRESSDLLESAGVARARQTIADADLTLVLSDLSLPARSDDRRLLTECQNALVIAHKSDLPEFIGMGKWESDVAAKWLHVSSVTGEGVNELTRAIAGRLVPEVPALGTPLPVTSRQVSLLRAALDGAERNELGACRAALRQMIR